MTAKRVQLVLVSEDKQHDCFIRYFLLDNGWSRHQLRSRVAPKGKGAASQWVLSEFPHELKIYRSQAGHLGNGLIITIDADTRTVREINEMLARKCEEAGVASRKQGDRVDFVIPRRNVETWLAYLRGESVNETDVYQKYECESACRQDVEKLHTMCKQGILEGTPPESLIFACEEYDRIKP
jgi:hypothetical protein